MRRVVIRGAKLACSFGSSSSQLEVLHTGHGVNGEEIANILDHEALVNILPFGTCGAMANPAVQAASAAAGTLTRVPCNPPAFTPWDPGAVYVLQNHGTRRIPILTNNSSCTCAFTGTITITDPRTDIEIK